MTIQRNLISTALMVTALAIAALPFIAWAYNSAQAAGFSQERQGKRANSKKPRRQATVRRKRGTASSSRRVVRKKTRKFQQRRRVVRPSRPAVTMPKTVIVTKPRPHARPAVTIPKTVTTGRPRPFARPAVTTPKTAIGGNAASDPTAGRINNRERAKKQAAYQQCARFSTRVQQGCYSQAQGNPQKQKACRTHYQSNVVRCQGLL
jgi:hypothetical protein